MTYPPSVRLKAIELRTAERLTIDEIAARLAVSRTTVFHWVGHQVLADLQRFWADLLGTTPDAIKLQRKSNSSALARRKWRCRHGVLTVRASDTILRARLQGWIDCVKDSWA